MGRRPDELLAIAVKVFDSENALGERFGIRASALVAAAMILGVDALDPS